MFKSEEQFTKEDLANWVHLQMLIALSLEEKDETEEEEPTIH